MAATDARPVPRKNAAYRVTFPIFDADGDLVSGAAGLDSEVSLDGGTFADCTNEATEIAAASGMYFLDLLPAEMNADTVSLIVKTSTVGAKTTPIVLYPEEAGDIRVDVTQWNGGTVTSGLGGRPVVDAEAISGSTVAADNLETNIANLDATVSTRATPANVSTALSDIRLDELMASALAAQPAVGSMLGDLTEDDAGTQRFSANALEQSPAGGGGGSGDWTAGEREQIRQALGITGTKAATSGGTLDNVKAKTDSMVFTDSDLHVTLDGEAVTVETNNDKTGYALSGSKQTLDALNDVSAADILTTALSESYAADGSAPTLSQAIFAIQQFLQERSVNGATVTVRRLDGTNTAMTFTMDSDTAPTSISRTT